jgi:hypothetical protein
LHPETTVSRRFASELISCTLKQNHQCKACGRQFVASPEDHIISEEQRTLIEHLLRERISLRGICRAVGVSLPWLLHVMVECFAACPDHLHVRRW